MRTLLLAALISAVPALAQPVFSTIYTFTGGSGGAKPAYLSAGAGGVLYGVATEGGTGAECRNGCGTIFALTTPATPGAAWTQTVLYNFGDPAGGLGPSSPLALGPGGALYGATSYAGKYNQGTIYSLLPPASPGGAWSYAVLYAFTGGADGSSPTGSLVLSANNVLYGTARYGGDRNVCSQGCGTVFALTPPRTGGGYWIETTLYSFPSLTGGYGPNGLIAFEGTLYGSTIWG